MACRMTWSGAAVSSASHVVQMVEEAYHAVIVFGDSLFLLNRNFLTIPALKKLGALNSNGGTHVDRHQGEKACIAFEKPGPRKLGRGRPPQKGAAIHQKELFLSQKEKFQKVETELYWNKGISLELEPLSIICLCSYCFRIECTFRELKWQTGAFCIISGLNI